MSQKSFLDVKPASRYTGRFGKRSQLMEDCTDQLPAMVLTPFGYSEEILSAIPYGCVVVDRKGTIQAVNPAALKLLSATAPQLLRQPLFEAIPAWADSDLERIFPHLMAGKALPEPSVFQLPGVEERWLQVSLRGLFGNSNGREHQGIVLVLADATELVTLKQRLRRTEYQASTGKLARGIAHELNNPLDGVLRYTHLALEQLSENTPVREYLVCVKEGLDRMVRATKAFLEFARQSTIPVQRMSDLNKLIEDALLLVQHRAKFQQIRIITNLDRSIPAVMDGGLVYAVVNLVRNAFDAMPRGGTLTVATERNGSSVNVRIEDTGSGISQEVQKQIFEPFFSTKPSHRGSGLGLVIAKEVVERSGGRLVFDSQLGVGTTFRIHVPIASKIPVTSGQEHHNGA